MTNLIDLPHLETLHLTREATKPGEVVAEWHRGVHEGRFDMCLEQPCHAVNAVLL